MVDDRAVSPTADHAQGPDSRDCPECAETIKSAAKLCRYCGYDLVEGKHRRFPQESSRRSRLSAAPVRVTKSPGVALGCSFLYPGLGQLYCEQIARGLIIAVAPPVLLILLFVAAGGPGLFVAAWLGYGVLFVWQLFDAHACAVNLNRAQRLPARGRGHPRSPGKARTRRGASRKRRRPRR